MQSEPTPRQRVRRMDRLHIVQGEPRTEVGTSPAPDTGCQAPANEAPGVVPISVADKPAPEPPAVPIYAVQARRSTGSRTAGPAPGSVRERPAVRRSAPAPQRNAVPVDRPTPRVARSPREEAAPAPIERPKRVPEEVPAAQAMPRWLTAAISLMAVLCVALALAQVWMTVYLNSQAQARADAHQALLDGHPRTFRPLIEQYAAEYNLQPAFVASIILNESSYRTGAESNVGARGLMQLMPATAEWIAGKLRVKNYSFDQLWDAETNIRFGCWYLNYLAEKFDGDPVAVTAAYHAGQGQVAAWLRDRSMSPDGHTLQVANMVEGPTKVYAGRVTRHYAIYDALYYHTFNPDVSAADAAGVRAP